MKVFQYKYTNNADIFKRNFYFPFLLICNIQVTFKWLLSLSLFLNISRNLHFFASFKFSSNIILLLPEEMSFNITWHADMLTMSSPSSWHALFLRDVCSSSYLSSLVCNMSFFHCCLQDFSTRLYISILLWCVLMNACSIFIVWSLLSFLKYN